MAANYIAFKHIFPSPFGYANFGESNRELNKLLINDIDLHREKNESKERTFRGNNKAWQSEGELENQYPNFEKLRKMIDETSKPILKHSGYSDSMVSTLRVRNLWSNVIDGIGGFSFPHIHPSAMILWTGVYYPNGMEEVNNLDEFTEQDIIKLHRQRGSGSLVLFDPSRNIKNLLSADYDDREYYGGEITIVPRESLLLLFPVWMTHMVMPMMSDEKRYSISFSIVKTYTEDPKYGHLQQ